MEVTGKHIVITGGSSGIGLQVIRRCLRNGALKVAVLDIHDNDDAIVSLQKEFPDKDVIYVQTDVMDNENVKTSFQFVKTRFGHFDIVIGNAGVADESNPQHTIQVNLIGLINSTYAAIDCMSKTQGGRGGTILNIASILGLNCYYSLPAYSASKHGVVGFTQSFGHKYYSNVFGIRFLTVCPGFTSTSFLEHMVKFEFDTILETRFNASLQYQTVDQAADAIAQVLQDGKHGTIWKVVGGELEEVSIVQTFKFADKNK